MAEITPADLASLDDFPLLWRWTRETDDRLPPEVLRTVCPLTTTKAAALATEAAALCAPRRVSALDLSISAPWDDPAPVAERLAALPVAPGEVVIASWDARTAVATRWDTFARYWSAFCYPSSDDVTVWAPGDDWVLCYRHFEFIEWGRRAAG